MHPLVTVSYQFDPVDDTFVRPAIDSGFEAQVRQVEDGTEPQQTTRHPHQDGALETWRQVWLAGV